MPRADGRRLLHRCRDPRSSCPARCGTPVGRSRRLAGAPYPQTLGDSSLSALARRACATACRIADTLRRTDSRTAGMGVWMRLGLNLGYWGAGNDSANLALAQEADRL